MTRGQNGSSATHHFYHSSLLYLYKLHIHGHCLFRFCLDSKSRNCHTQNVFNWNTFIPTMSYSRAYPHKIIKTKKIYQTSLLTDPHFNNYGTKEVWLRETHFDSPVTGIEARAMHRCRTRRRHKNRSSILAAVCLNLQSLFTVGFPALLDGAGGNISLQ